jgi:hypothetical protein
MSPQPRHKLLCCCLSGNAGSVDHPEHHAQARSKWNERYELIVRLDATAKEKESGLPVESSTRVFGAKVHRGRSAATDELVAVARKSRLCSSPLLCWVVFTGPFNRSYCCCLYQSSISLLT